MSGFQNEIDAKLLLESKQQSFNYNRLPSSLIRRQIFICSSSSNFIIIIIILILLLFLFLLFFFLLSRRPSQSQLVTRLNRHDPPHGHSVRQQTLTFTGSQKAAAAAAGRRSRSPEARPRSARGSRGDQGSLSELDWQEFAKDLEEDDSMNLDDLASPPASEPAPASPHSPRKTPLSSTRTTPGTVLAPDTAVPASAAAAAAAAPSPPRVQAPHEGAGVGQLQEALGQIEILRRKLDKEQRVASDLRAELEAAREAAKNAGVPDEVRKLQRQLKNLESSFALREQVNDK